MRVMTRRLLEEQIAVVVVLESGKKDDAMWHVPQWAAIVNRLRCGHTSLTHAYLMNSDVREVAPGRPVCQDATLTVRLLLLECRELQLIRRQCFSVNRHHNNVNIVNILGNDCKLMSLSYF